MNEVNYFTFCCSSSKKKSGAYILKLPQGDEEWKSKWRKGTKGENLKKSFRL